MERIINRTNHITVYCQNKNTEKELEEYEAKYPMPPAEKRVLRKWVAVRHSVYEHPGSRCICMYGAYPPRYFLDVYRMDRKDKAGLKRKIQGGKGTIAERIHRLF